MAAVRPAKLLRLNSCGRAQDSRFPAQVSSVRAGWREGRKRRQEVTRRQKEDRSAHARCC
jgi:hypothetical protein